MSKPSNWEIPDGTSPPEQWHRLSFDFKVANYPVDWDVIDAREFAVDLTKILTYCLLRDKIDDDSADYEEPARTHIKRISIERTDFLTDDELSRFLDGLS